MLYRSAYATTFFLACSVGLVFVFLEDFKERYHLADWEFGVFASAGFVAALITQLALSPLVDRGLVKPLAYLSILCGAGGTIGMIIADDFLTLSIARGITGIGLGLFSISARKAVLGLDLEGGGEKVGALLGSGVAGFICGPALGAALEPISFNAPFIVMGVAIALVGFPTARLVSATPIDVSPVVYGDFGRLLRARKVQAALGVQVLIGGMIGVFDSTIDLFLTELGASTTQVAITLVVMGSPMIVLPRIAGRIAQRLGGSRVVMPGLFMIVLSVFLYGWAGGFIAVALFGLVHAVGESFSAIAAQVMILEETGTEQAAIGSAAMDAVSMFLAAIAAFVAPIVYGQWGGPATFRLTAGIGVLVIGFVASRVVPILRHGSGSTSPETAGQPTANPVTTTS